MEDPTLYAPENESLFYWGRHTCCEKDVPTVREVTDPLIQLAREYLKEPKNGVMHDLATNGTLTRDPRGIMETTVKDFVCYVAHRLQTSLRRDAWKEDPMRTDYMRGATTESVDVEGFPEEISKGDK